MADLKGKVGIVTGGGTGIARAVALAMARAGAARIIRGDHMYHEDGPVGKCCVGPTNVDLRVPCEGRVHRVLLDGRGRMVLPHHPRPAIPQWEAVWELGGKCWRCLEVLLVWRALNRGRDQDFYDRLPKPFRAALDQAGETRVRRARARGLHQGLDACPVREEPGFIAHVINSVLRDKLGLPGVTARVLWSPGPGPYRVELRAGERVLFSHRVVRDWFRSVFAKGHAALQGGLTLRLSQRATRAVQAAPRPRPGGGMALRRRSVLLPTG